ncbi:3-oxoacyl-[acyl-carrier-protein] synthase III C-terminal domain-containing protein [Streptomyces sp. ME19-01-6]|uniref:3-oxoacyl-[acyl-carrier-protein] synthase III C-terminal domain-containing protein n=1 Tax=Streptomyces sp. ME19-01-6 TaxID=3028686 RepID=UPI0029ADBD41|nr:3-oxoacyl-[acyl-carrier-protein] synthase III C-terminal domain-containing protein [Streptomyces sp. ME19-01-6]MDX3229143.1 3-oxoacyl-[acyl-carrier-protein] synthase III C-terminal domain-containing protein [Streptomyces sp. ME19-01-6]
MTTTVNGGNATAVGIGAIHCVLPEERFPVDKLPELDNLPRAEADFARGCGIRTVSRFTDEATPAGLAAQATRELLDGADREPDVLLAVGARAPEVLLGSDSGRIATEAGLTSAFSFVLDGLGCTGSSTAWSLARDLLVADPSRHSVLITHASRPVSLDRVRYPVTVIGDGAFAMTMVLGGRPVLRAHRQETDGKFHDLFRVDYKSAPWYEWREECQSSDRYRFELALHSQQRLARLVDEVLAEAGADRAQIAATLMQNVTAPAFQFYESFLGLPIHPVCGRHLAEYGHLGAMDVVLNLDRLLATGELAPGDLVLVLNNSPVAAWAVTLWEV